MAYPALSVSIGSKDGTVLVCNQGLSCDEVHATSLEELADLVVGAEAATLSRMNETVSVLGSFAEMRQDITLDGEPARYESFVYPGTMWLGAPAFNHVLAFIGGRPVVLAFDHWTFNTPLSARERQIIESFRLLDGQGP
jgi:hypothetical protein